MYPAKEPNMRDGCYGIGIIAAIMLMAALQQPVFAQSKAVNQDKNEAFLTFIPSRNAAEIKRLVDLSDQEKKTAAENERTALDQRVAIAAKIEEKRQAIAANNEKQKDAKSQKKNADALLLSTEGKALEREKAMLERRASLRDAEIILARTKSELANLKGQALDMERQLALKRAEQTGSSLSGVEQAKDARRLLDTEKVALEALKNVAQKESDVANAYKKVIDKQISMLEAQQAIYGGK
jgi:hypothetical protein